MVDEGRADRFPCAPAAKSNAASPHALPTQSVKIGGFTYLQIWEKNIFIQLLEDKNSLVQKCN